MGVRTLAGPVAVDPMPDRRAGLSLEDYRRSDELSIPNEYLLGSTAADASEHPWTLHPWSDL